MRKLAAITSIAVLTGALATAYAVTRPDEARQPQPAPPAPIAQSNVDGDAPVVVELFTSQGCSSCPPAEAYFRELAQREDVIALEWHVDYWDDLRHGAAGIWKDPYSSADNTNRQRSYNISLRGTSAVYTPQAIIAGAREAVGSDRNAVARLIRAASRTPSMQITAARPSSTDDDIQFHLANAPPDAQLALVTFQTNATTSVTRGENHGKTLASAHIVTALEPIDQVRAPNATISVPKPGDGQGCALIAQQKIDGKGTGAVLAGAYCPD